MSTLQQLIRKKSAGKAEWSLKKAGGSTRNQSSWNSAKCTSDC